MERPQSGGNHCGNLHENLGEGPRFVDVLENAAALPLQVDFDLRASRHDGGLAPHLVFQGPAPGGHDEDHDQERTEGQKEIARVEQGRPDDDGNIIKVTQQDVIRDGL